MYTASRHSSAETRIAHFDFWGARTNVVVPTQHDLDHLEYYFRDYVAMGGEQPVVTVALQTTTATPYLMTATGNRRVVVDAHSEGATRVLLGEQTVTSPTPLPPFSMKPLADRFATIHAAAVAHPVHSDAALILHGPSTVGKSSLALQLLHRGWKFLSDDTSPIDDAGRVHPFTRPIGVRARTLRRLGPAISRVSAARSYETTLGTTLSVHPRDLGFPISPPARIRWIVSLRPASEFAISRKSPNRLEMSLDIEVDEQRAVSAIESLCDERN